ncbi:MAG: HPr family phosphocarrier protein, partial [Zetaproteobacteria bacterium CG_4_9_14_3_um_filter_53_7]
TELKVRAEGQDADAALDAIEALVNNRFGESE